MAKLKRRAWTRQANAPMWSVCTTAANTGSIGTSGIPTSGSCLPPNSRQRFSAETLIISRFRGTTWTSPFYGTIAGYPINGTKAPWKTTFYGLYDRAIAFDMKPPYNLPKRFLDRKDKLDLATPLNFVLTCDITGGNSGSPVVNRNGELVGLLFDGNIESLVGNFVYDSQRGRAIAVHGSAISEALRKVYDAGALADALEAMVPAAMR